MLATDVGGGPRGAEGGGGGARLEDEGRTLDELGIKIPTKDAAIGPIRPIDTAARIVGAVGPGIDGPTVEVATVADADDGQWRQMGEGELKMR